MWWGDALPQPCCYHFRLHHLCAVFGVACTALHLLHNCEPWSVGAGGIDPCSCPLRGAVPDRPSIRPTLPCPTLLVTCLLLLSLQQPQSPDRSN